MEGVNKFFFWRTHIYAIFLNTINNFTNFLKSKLKVFPKERKQMCLDGWFILRKTILRPQAEVEDTTTLSLTGNPLLCL